VRNAGGGGRPGGKPALNWKERMALRLSAKNQRKEFRVKPMGNFDDDLAPFFDSARGDVMVDVSKMDFFELKAQPEEVLGEGVSNTRKVIDIRKLFGSSKPFGSLPRKQNFSNKQFGHAATFGYKGGAASRSNHKEKAPSPALEAYYAMVKSGEIIEKSAKGGKTSEQPKKRSIFKNT